MSHQPMNKDDKEGFDGLSHEVTTLSQRVGTVETNVQALLSNDASNQQTLGRVVAGLESLSETVADLSGKLDAARTRRPELGAMASVAVVIITIGTLVMVPVYRDLARQAKIDDHVYQELSDSVGLIARSTTRLDNEERRADDLSQRVLEIERNLFTKEDAWRLEDRLRE